MILKKIWVMVVCLLLLSGCSGGDAPSKTAAVAFRSRLLEAGGCRFTAELTADYGSEFFPFTLECDYTAGGDASFTVTQPLALAGIGGTVSGEGSCLSFDGMALDLGVLANGYAAPLEAPWLFGQCWSGAYIESVGTDGDMTVVCHLYGYGDARLRLETWLDETGIPVHCDCSYDGRRCLTAEIRGFQLKELDA